MVRNGIVTMKSTYFAAYNLLTGGENAPIMEVIINMKQNPAHKTL